MGKKPFHHRAWHAARRMIALATAFALIVAPVVVILTHGPAAHAFAASMAADMTVELAGHGHAHDEAEHDHAGGSLGGHNPADHEHQLHALVCQTADVAKPLPDKAQCVSGEAFRHLTPEGPRRPPRLI